MPSNDMIDDTRDVMLVKADRQQSNSLEPTPSLRVIRHIPHSDLTTIPTLFPAPIASLITTLATSARVSMNVINFFIEAILESSQFSTRLSLGYTRRLLISAVSSARDVYLFSQPSLMEPKSTSTDTFLDVLDKYTNLGIYVVHHTFSMAELFTMSGFYLTSHAIHSAHFAAQESVAILDSLSGSNESSRALSSIIMMVRRELLDDERFGKVVGLTALTKALTCFAVLQGATWRRTEGRIKMRTLYDCTVATSRGKGLHSKENMAVLNNLTATSSPRSLVSSDAPRGAVDGPGPSTMAARESRQQEECLRLDGLEARLREALPDEPFARQTPKRLQPADQRWVSELTEKSLSPGTSRPRHRRQRSDPLPLPCDIESDSEYDPKQWVTTAPHTPRRNSFCNDGEDWCRIDRSLDVLSVNHTSGPGLTEGEEGEEAFHPTKKMSDVLLRRQRRIRRLRVDPLLLGRGDHRSVVHKGGSRSRGGSTVSRWFGGRKGRPISLFRSYSLDDLDLSGEITPPSRPESAEATRPPPSSPVTVPGRSNSQSVDSSSGSEHPFSPVTPHVFAQSRLQVATAEAIHERGAESPTDLFPHDSIVKNIHRFMRFSSAAYGQQFLRLFGLGNSDYNFPSSGRHHANSWAFAQHTGIPMDDLILSSYMEQNVILPRTKAPPLVHYISVDHTLAAVVLTCRGTLGLSDVLIDLAAEYRSIHVDGGDRQGEYYVHSGMYQSALGLTARNSTVHETLVRLLDQYPSYGLVVCGHSLGGGVASLLAILCATPSDTFLRQNTTRSCPVRHPTITTPFVTSFSSGLPAGRPIHAYAYGPPAVASPDLAEYAKGLITSVVHNSDVVPCLTLGLLRDLKNIAVTLHEEGHVAEEIVGRVVGLYQRKFPFQREPSQSAGGTLSELLHGFAHPEPTVQQANDGVSDEQILSDWLLSCIKTMRADMGNDKLYPPGTVYILDYYDVFMAVDGDSAESGRGGTVQQAHRVVLRQCDSVEERFREPLFTKTMLNDHLPSHYERATQLLFDGVRGVGK